MAWTADKLNKQAESSTQTDEVLAAEDAALAEAQAKEKAATTKEVSSSRAIGKKVTAANANEDSAVARIKNDVDNFTKSVAEITGSIQGAVNGANEFVGKKKQQLFELIDTHPSTPGTSLPIVIPPTPLPAVALLIMHKF